MPTIHDHLIPLAADQAVSAGWTAATGYKPVGVTWHWTATATLAECRAMLGGANATRKGQASAHFAVGRSAAEGTDRYVSLENRSWHAGYKQSLRWDGRSMSSTDYRGTRTCVGVETVHVGYARDGFPAGPDWIPVHTPDGQKSLLVAPWPAEQLSMMIEIGRLVQQRWPHLGVRDHHGHVDLCPRDKEDVLGFPFAALLRGIYADPSVPDVWSPCWTTLGRQRALVALGYDLGRAGADGIWGPRSDAALRRFQYHRGLVQNGLWTGFVSWAAYDAIKAKGRSWPVT